jgi:selenide,water dikinase
VRRLVLVGGGHAHLHVLRALARRPVAGVAVTLVSPEPGQLYSGMVPGYLQGTYAERDLVVDLPPLARAAGAGFVQAMAEAVDPRAGAVATSAGLLHFDWLSLDVGSVPAGRDTPGVREHAVAARPLGELLGLRARADAARAAAGPGPVPAAVVGAGAGGIEVALALDRRLRRPGAPAAVTLVEAGPHVLADWAPRARRRVERILARRGLRVLTGQPVAAVEPGVVVTVRGGRVPAALTAWLAGAAAPPLLAASALPRDERGFLLVDATLRAVDGAPVWGAGDCVTLAEHPGTPKAGVYAVRQGPVLARSLRAELAGGAPARYRPQAGFLALLNTADGKAVLRWRGLLSHSRWAFRLKDAIDRRFVARYRQAAGGRPS